MDYLQHIGVLGMRWGIRRKSKTSSGGSQDHKTASLLKRKKLSDMSNEELKKLTTRLQLEKQFKDLNKKELTAGQKFVSDILVGTGKTLASKYIGVGVEKGANLLKDVILEKTKK